MTDCLFCRIARKEMDSEVVAETERVLAFRDIAPQAPTHVLVVTKEHVASAAELGRGHGDVLGEMFETIAGVARAEGVEGGYRVVTNVGAGAGQSVPHLHFHVLGGRPLEWPPG